MWPTYLNRPQAFQNELHFVSLSQHFANAIKVWNSYIWHQSPQLQMELNVSHHEWGKELVPSVSIGQIPMQWNRMVKWFLHSAEKQQNIDLSTQTWTKLPQMRPPGGMSYSLLNSLLLIKRCEKTRHYKATILEDSRAPNMKKTA